MKLKATVIGATGLVGSQLIRQLLNDNKFENIDVFVRRSTGLSHPKLTEHLVDFNHIQAWSDQIRGDVLFSALGTTIKKAGSKEKQYLVDYTYQHQAAQAAAKNGVANYVLVSSAGANAKSKIFYSRMKGELEEAVSKMAFHKIAILRPSILDGNRKEKRDAEAISLKITRWLTRYILKKYRPIKDAIVARAMINSVNMNKQPGGHFTYELDKIFPLAGK